MSNQSNNIFQDVLTDVNGVQERLLGPNYKYYENINTPSDIGMSSKGTMSALSSNVNGLISYVELLVQGSGKASKTGKPLGNKFFLKTGAQCKDKDTNAVVDRYIYINNVPVGNIPIISGTTGINFSEFKGLIPGTISDLNVLNPFAIMQSFLSGSTPTCQELTMETIDVNNNRSSETHYVTLVDIQNMDPCAFKDGKNVLTGQRCKQSFQNMGTHLFPPLTPSPVNSNDDTQYNLPEDPIIQLYFASLSLLGIYLLYKLNTRR